MLYVPGVPDFRWTADFWGTGLNAGNNQGIGVSTHATTAHTKGTAVTLLSAIAEDCYGIFLAATTGGGSATIQRFLADLLIDPAGGTSWSVAIANLYFAYPHTVAGGCNYYFPLYLKAGTAIGMQMQGNNANVASRIVGRIFGKPSHPELVKCGQKVQTYGADTANSQGTAITPGSSAWGAYASAGTSSFDQWYWQAGIGWNDTTITSNGYYLRLAGGDATNKQILGEFVAGTYSTELCGLATLWPPIKAIKSGETIYCAAGCPGQGPDTTPTFIVYGLG